MEKWFEEFRLIMINILGIASYIFIIYIIRKKIKERKKNEIYSTRNDKREY